MGRICCRIMQDAPLDCMIPTGLRLNHKCYSDTLLHRQGLLLSFCIFPAPSEGLRFSRDGLQRHLADSEKNENGPYEYLIPGFQSSETDTANVLA